MSAKLNERNEKTKKKIHLLVTTLCDRNCPHCCNRQYDLNEIPTVTHEELLEAEEIFITGGEPMIYSNPSRIARWLYKHYPNIKDVYVYTNVRELVDAWAHCSSVYEYIHGFTISIKDKEDAETFERVMDSFLRHKYSKSDRIYDFVGVSYADKLKKHFDYYKRDWQEEFVPADDSIFRKLL